MLPDNGIKIEINNNKIVLKILKYLEVKQHISKSVMTYRKITRKDRLVHYSQTIEFKSQVKTVSKKKITYSSWFLRLQQNLSKSRQYMQNHLKNYIIWFLYQTAELAWRQIDQWNQTEIHTYTIIFLTKVQSKLNRKVGREKWFSQVMQESDRQREMNHESHTSLYVIINWRWVIIPKCKSWNHIFLKESLGEYIFVMDKKALIIKRKKKIKELDIISLF